MQLRYSTTTTSFRYCPFDAPLICLYPSTPFDSPLIDFNPLHLHISLFMQSIVFGSSFSLWYSSAQPKLPKLYCPTPSNRQLILPLYRKCYLPSKNRHFSADLSLPTNSSHRPISPGLSPFTSIGNCPPHRNYQL